MDGLRIDTTGEVEVTLNKGEASTMIVALTLLGFEDSVGPCTKENLKNMVHCLEQLGVDY